MPDTERVRWGSGALFDPRGYVTQERGRERPGEAPAYPSAHSLLLPSREGRGTFCECLLDPLGRLLPSSLLRRGWETCVEPPSSGVKRGGRGAFAGGGTQSA